MTATTEITNKHSHTHISDYNSVVKRDAIGKSQSKLCGRSAPKCASRIACDVVVFIVHNPLLLWLHTAHTVTHTISIRQYIKMISQNEEEKEKKKQKLKPIIKIQNVV